MKKASKLLHRREDLSGVLHCALVWSGYLAAFTLLSFPSLAGLDTLPRKVCFVLSAAFLLGLAGGANLAFNLHNHAHHPFFRSPRHNRLFGMLGALTAGWSWRLWSHLHHEHHATLGTPQDFTSPRPTRRGGTEGMAGYVLFRHPLRQLLRLRETHAEKRLPEATGAERLAFACLWAAPFLLGPWVGLGLWLLPHVVANVFVLSTHAYASHLGLRADPAARHTLANSFDAPFFSRVCYHAGLATVHHAYPTLHWMDLPERNERDLNRMLDVGTHVLPFGPFHSIEVLGVFTGVREAHEEFARTQADGFGTPHGLQPARRAEAEGPESSERARHAA